MMLPRRRIKKMDLKQFFIRVLPSALFCCFVRYLVSDDPPDRPFPVSFRPEVCNNCFPCDFKRILEPPKNICVVGAKVDVVILITTIPSAREARMAVRETWGNKSLSASKTVRFVFLFGGGYSRNAQRLIEAEAAKQGDILQENFLDNYYNLSLKVIMGYKWVMNNCPQAAFVARSAEDNFINIPALVYLLTTRILELQSIMFGSCENYALPWRWPFHKWAISLKEYSGVLFPPYCVGTTFVTSLQMTKDLVAISPHVPFFPIEDVYFGMCMKLLAQKKYKTRTISGFNLLPPRGTENPRRGHCPYPRPMYTVHPLKPHHIRRMWQQCMPGVDKT